MLVAVPSMLEVPTLVTIQFCVSDTDCAHIGHTESVYKAIEEWVGLAWVTGTWTPTERVCPDDYITHFSASADTGSSYTAVWLQLSSTLRVWAEEGGNCEDNVGIRALLGCFHTRKPTLSQYFWAGLQWQRRQRGVACRSGWPRSLH